MNDRWYGNVGPEAPLTQGDLVFDCPVIGWKDAALIDASSGALPAAIDAFQADVVVMTQACDLEHDKVSHVVLCPHYSLSTHQKYWEEAMRAKGMNPSKRAWDSYFDDLCNGFMWNASLLNRDGEKNGLSIDHRVVEFHEIYTIPRTFLESLLRQRNTPRLRLLPPYREHLSQAFARFFMRVGLPVPVEKPTGIS